MNKIIRELEHHAPFTAFGAFTGIILMLVFRNMPRETAHTLFYLFHPLHVLMSAIVTAAMFKLHEEKTVFWKVLLIGYVGSIGIATLSDSLIPYWGELLLNLPHVHAHIGFIEEWWLINPAAVLGVLIGYFLPRTKLPHAGHVLLSTWASLFHIMMAMGAGIAILKYIGIFIFLFISVWIPCCVSDIVFPLLFVKGKGTCGKKGCHYHGG